MASILPGRRQSPYGLILKSERLKRPPMMPIEDIGVPVARPAPVEFKRAIYDFFFRADKIKVELPKPLVIDIPPTVEPDRIVEQPKEIVSKPATNIVRYNWFESILNKIKKYWMWLWQLRKRRK